MQAIRKRNQDLLMLLSEGSAAEAEVWRGKDVFDFYLAVWAKQEFLQKRAKANKGDNNEPPDGREGRNGVRGVRKSDRLPGSDGPRRGRRRGSP